MASNLVNRISSSVKKLIVGNSASKQEVPEEAPMEIATVSVREMLFGLPTKLDFEAPLGSVHGSSANAAVGLSMRNDEESMDSNNLSFHDGMTNAVSGAIDVDGVSCENQKVLLVFPFLGAGNVEEACNGLPLCDTGDDATCSQLITNQLEKSVGRNHLQTITEVDRESLRKDNYVNDVIVDFWMLWLSRNIRKDKSLEYFFTSHCYSKLTQCGGREQVSTWLSRRRNFSIFEKRIIYFPIVLDNHWSLCACYNPGMLQGLVSSGGHDSATVDVPVILHLDSLKLHDSRAIAENIRQLFTFQWQNEFPDLEFVFTKHNYPVICPIVPRQTNGHDCGLFVCLYAAGLHKIREQLFSYSDLYNAQSPLFEKITKNTHFQFDQSIVNDFRVQLGTLVDNLSSVYHNGTVHGGKKVLHLKGRHSADNSKGKKKATTDSRGKKRRATIGTDTSPRKRSVGKLQSTISTTSPSTKSRRRKKHGVEQRRRTAPPINFSSDDDSILQVLALDPFIASPVPKVPEILPVIPPADITFEKPSEILPVTEVVIKNVAVHSVATPPEKASETPMVATVVEKRSEILPVTEVVIKNVAVHSVATPPEKATETPPVATVVEKRSEMLPATKLVVKKSAAHSIATPPEKATETPPVATVVEKRSEMLPATKLVVKKSAAPCAKKANGRKVLSGTADEDNMKMPADALIGKTVAFARKSNVCRSLISTLGDKFNEKGMCYELDKDEGHIVGTVLRRNKCPKSKTTISTNYNVIWEYTTFGDSDLAGIVLVDAEKEGQKIVRKRDEMKRKVTKVTRSGRKSKGEVTRNHFIKNNLTKVSDDEADHAPSSDASYVSEDEESDDWSIGNDWMDSLCDSHNETLLEVEQNEGMTELPYGLHWDYAARIHSTNENKMEPTPTTVKPDARRLFKTPIDSVMAVFPLLFWETITNQINKYAAFKIKQRQGEKKVKRPNLIASHKWFPAALPEVMTYFGLLIYFMLHPQVGRRVRDAWDSPYSNAWTKFMTKSRFLQIGAMLHFNDNEDEEGLNNDSLHKIRPLLNIMKITLAKFAIFGSELSLDEATMSNKSSYARFLICFNPMKPTGKFHFKIYMVCCAESNLTLRIKIHTKDNADVEGNETYNDCINKLDNLTLGLCRPFYNSGTTINMDNYYMSTTCAMKLREKGVYCRGTIRATRKYVPKGIQFNSIESRTLPRGTHRMAVNEEHQMLAVGWVDSKAVYFVSTADTTEIVTVSRRIGSEKLDVRAPLAIANYNKFMGGVDRHDRLRSTFSLSKKHHFKKYYVKLMLFLLDIGLTNSWIYYKKCNEQLCLKEGSRAAFFEAVAEAMVNISTKWSAYASQEGILVAGVNQNSDGEIRSTLPNIGGCIPAGLDSIPAKIGVKMRVCQVCSYEMRRFKWKSVTVCTTHGVRLCTEVRQSRAVSEPKLHKLDGTPVTNWKWTCETNDTCWNKFHDFYLQEGLFNNNFVLASPQKCKFAGIIYTSRLHQLKYQALGVTVNVKAGNTAGVGRINEKVHIAPAKKHELEYLQQNSETEEVEDDSDEDIDSVYVKEYFE